jgi:hypothetical protein
MRANHLRRDLQALRYLDALDAGDLETVAAMWEEASHDPELERTLAELDGALAKAAIVQPRRARRRRAVWWGVAAVLAAACVLAMLGRPRKDVKKPPPGPGPNEITQDFNGAPVDSANLATWRESRQATEDAEAPFRWPLPEPAPVRVAASVPSDLLD